jgi:hypothetical protein
VGLIRGFDPGPALRSVVVEPQTKRARQGAARERNLNDKLIVCHCRSIHPSQKGCKRDNDPASEFYRRGDFSKLHRRIARCTLASGLGLTVDDRPLACHNWIDSRSLHVSNDF